MPKASTRRPPKGAKGRSKSVEQTVRVGLRKALPILVREMSDMLEKRPPRMTNQAKREMQCQIDQYIRKSVPLINELERSEGDPLKTPEAYEKFELLIRTWMDSLKIKGGEKDSLEGYLREFNKLVRLPADGRRIAHVRRVYEGIQRLIETLAIDPEKEKAANELIHEFGRHHRRQYMRYFHGFEARQRSNRNVDFRRMTRRNITVLTDEYRDGAAALEKRLQMIVGLNNIAKGSPTSYGQLRKLGLRNLCDTIASPKNPQLHFLRNTVDPTVRNALAHDGADPVFSKLRINFVGRSETIAWTISQFLKNTMRLIQTVRVLTYLESLFTYATLELSIARLRQQVQLSSQRKASVKPARSRQRRTTPTRTSR